MKKVILYLLAGLFLLIGAVAISFPDQSYLLALIIWVNLRAKHHPPVIAQGVITDKDWLHWEDGSRKINTLVNRKFPVGSSTKKMETALRDQEFEYPSSPPARCINDDEHPPEHALIARCPAWDRSWDPHHELRYSWGGAPCDQTISVRWSSDGSARISHIEGFYGGGCL